MELYEVLMSSQCIACSRHQSLHSDFGESVKKSEGDTI